MPQPALDYHGWGSSRGRPGGPPYRPARLLTIGDPRTEGVEERVAALGLDQEHVPDLARMAVDLELNEAGGARGLDGDTGAPLADMALWTFGLPYAEVAPGGEVLVLYYAGTPAAMDIRYARLRA